MTDLPPPAANPALAAHFLDAVFAGAEGYAHLWTLEDQRSYWSAADQLANSGDLLTKLVNSGHNLYFCAGIYGAPLGERQRGSQDLVRATVGVSVDLDVAGPGHAKKNLPPTIEAALALVAKFGLSPTIVVHSGHGLQLWYLWREPLTLDSAAEQAAAVKLAADVQGSYRWLARERGWTVDSTQDLCRLMRLPGGVNAKPGQPPVAVTMLSEGGPRYNPSELREHLFVDTSYDPGAPRTGGGGSSAPAQRPDGSDTPLVLDPDAYPDPDGLAFMLDAAGGLGARFRRTWERKRYDFPSGDQSASSYDLALANVLVRAGWDDQEIVNACIMWRRRHGELNAKKIARLDYWLGTSTRLGLLAKARAGQEPVDLEAEDEATPEGQVHADQTARQAKAQLAAATAQDRARVLGAVAENTAAQEAFDAAADPEAKEAGRLRLLETASRALGIRIHRVVQYMAGEIEYRIVVGAQQEIPIGNALKFQEQKHLRAAVMDAIQNYPLVIGRDDWPGIVRALVKASERVDAPPELTLAGKAHAWVTEYLKGNTAATDAQKAQEGMQPWIDEHGAVWLFSTPFVNWANGQVGRPDTAAIIGALRALGAVQENVHIVQDRKRTTRSAWRLPYNPLTPVAAPPIPARSVPVEVDSVDNGGPFWLSSENSQ